MSDSSPFIETFCRRKQRSSFLHHQYIPGTQPQNIISKLKYSLAPVRQTITICVLFYWNQHQLINHKVMHQSVCRELFLHQLNLRPLPQKSLSVIETEHHLVLAVEVEITIARIKKDFHCFYICRTCVELVTASPGLARSVMVVGLNKEFKMRFQKGQF